MQKIIVDNFGPIKHAEIELRDFVVLIGEQASGKSTLAKLVYFFRSLTRKFFWEREDNQSLDRNVLMKQFEDIIQKYFIQFYGKAKGEDQFKIVFVLDFEKSGFLTITSANNDIKSINIIWSDGANKMLDDILTKAKTVIGDKQYIKLGRKNISGGGEAEYFDIEVMNNRSIWQDIVQMFMIDVTAHAIYFPAERVLETSFADYFPTALLNYFQSNPSLFNQASIIIMREYLEHAGVLKSAFRNHGGFDEMIANQKLAKPNEDYSALYLASLKAEKILKANYKVVGEQEILMISNPERNIEISLGNASTGQQEVLRILQDIILILSNRTTIAHRVIEEPEAHLFPTAQKYLLELLVLMANETHSQIFITTHSPYVLSVLSNLLYAKKISDLGAASIGEIEEKAGMNHKTWLDKNQFAAYTMDKGEAKSIFDRNNTGLIDQNYLDKVSEDLGREFQVLHNFRLTQIRKEKHI